MVLTRILHYILCYLQRVRLHRQHRLNILFGLAYAVVG